MMILIDDHGIRLGESQKATEDEIKSYILTELATTFSDDMEFLRKVNKLTFGLQSN